MASGFATVATVATVATFEKQSIKSNGYGGGTVAMALRQFATLQNRRNSLHNSWIFL